MQAFPAAGFYRCANVANHAFLQEQTAAAVDPHSSLTISVASAIVRPKPSSAVRNPGALLDRPTVQRLFPTPDPNLPESRYLQMTASLRISRIGFAGFASCASLFSAMLLACGGSALAQRAPFAAPESRIVLAVDDATRTVVPGSRPGQARFGVDAGRMAATTPIENASIVLSRSAAQQTALDALTAAQQNPSSPAFHQWLSADEFAAQFGASSSDLAKVQSWLERLGLGNIQISRNRSILTFSGTVGQIEAAFGTEMHRYTIGNETHFAPSTDLSVPAAMASAVLSVGNLSDFRPHSHMIRGNAAATAVAPGGEAKANFTSSQSGNHFVQPGDVAVIYDVNAAYSAGYTGANQTITVIGQSAVVASDVTNFQTAAGVPVRAPNLILMPNSGTSTVYSGDESESDLDLEYTSAMAKGATINFLYTGNSQSYGAFDAFGYAVQQKIGQIISVSYGTCEPALGATNYATYNAYTQQAAAQGQSVVVAAGDAGSDDCYSYTSLGSPVQGALAADWPAGSQYVTAMGGTEYTPSAVVGSNSQYFTAANGSDVLVSAKSYIPEQVWNDDSTTGGLSAGGGGVSIFSPRMPWQAGVPGIPAGSYRLVPDISLASSPNNAGYLYCSSDATGTGITGSCTNGFRDANNASLTIAGGTSFAAPIFAGMLAIINQKIGATTGQGLINPTLYTLASNANTYASAFHDITIGNNGCTSGSAYPTGTNKTTGATIYGPACSASIAGQYATGTGYDQATGLGSIDLYNLMQAWPNATQTTGTNASTTTLSAASSSITAGSADILTFKVASKVTTVTTVPTGTISLADNGIVVAGNIALTAGQATYSYTPTTTATHTLVATYSGDATFATSYASSSIAVTASPGTFTLSAPALSLTAGNTGSETVTVTPSGGFVGGVALTFSTTSTIVNACYLPGTVTVGGASPASNAITIYTNSTTCPGNASALSRAGGTRASVDSAPHFPMSPLPTGFALAGLLAVGFVGRRSRRLQGVVLIALLAIGGSAIAGCGSTAAGVSGPPTTAPTGSYTVTVTGVDTATKAKTATTTFTLTIQ
jgi:subtilase family serine protease